MYIVGHLLICPWLVSYSYCGQFVYIVSLCCCRLNCQSHKLARPLKSLEAKGFLIHLKQHFLQYNDSGVQLRPLRRLMWIGLDFNTYMPH